MNGMDVWLDELERILCMTRSGQGRRRRRRRKRRNFHKMFNYRKFRNTEGEIVVGATKEEEMLLLQIQQNKIMMMTKPSVTRKTKIHY